MTENIDDRTQSMKPIKNKFSNESGFTLIEVLIAAVLLVFGLIAFGVFSGNMVQKNTLLERKTIAATAAQDKMEELKNQAQNAILVTGTTTDTTDIESGTDTLDRDGGTGGFTIFTRTWLLEDSATGVSEPIKITVTVTWEGAGTTSYTVITLLSQD